VLRKAGLTGDALSVQYYYADGDVQKGPFAKSELAVQGVRPETLVWREGLAEWQAAGALPELSDVLGAWTGASEPGVIPLALEPQYAGQPQGPAFYPQQPYGYGAQPPGYAPGFAGGPGPLLAYGGYTPPPTQSSGMAIASMILGILSIPLLWAYGAGVLCAIVAVVLGHVARGKARRKEAGGGGMALAGVICGYISLALVLTCVSLLGLIIVSSRR
jgi:hypothetical protein